jgi:3-dehydroquinate dehydratase/shikimate dehydrogenase
MFVMETKLIVPIPVKNPEQAKWQVTAAKAAGAEMLELRIDYIENLSVELVGKLIAEVKEGDKPLPVVVTCRDERQGGAKDYPNQLRLDVLAAALKAGADFIDFEYENFLKPENREKIMLTLSQSPGKRLILSAHDFESKFDDINRLYEDIKAACPEAIPKLVYTANHINDCFDAFDLLNRTSGDERIVFCMGQAGLVSRILAKKLGCLVTFASIDDDSATAPGQVTIKQFRELYRYEQINADTELFGVIADPVGHSLSPAIHNACFAEKQMNRLYLPFWVKGEQEEFDSFLDNVLERDWLDFRGFSVTIPHKQSALDYVRAKDGFVEPLAEKIGAVNTLIISEDGELSAYNTDYAGALDAITSGMGIERTDFDSMPVVIVGAGGVSRAIVAGLSDAGAKIRIYNRTVAKAQNLAAEFDCEYGPLDDLKNLDAKLIVNCTSIGMHPKVDAAPVPAEFIKSDMAVFDTVYNPAETLLLRQAKEKGAKTIDGVSMFVNQAMAQFKLFTDTTGDAELMHKVVMDNFKN